jgi:ribonuclease E
MASRSDQKVMLVNVVEEQEVRIAVLEGEKLEQLYLERASSEQIVGNIYKGRIVNVVPNIEAAFVEFGYRKHGFLHVSDVRPSAVGNGGRSGDIRKLLREGQQVMVQVTKEAIGDKGPSLTTYLSLPGRYLVLMPGISRRGVSRRISDDSERQRLRKMLRDLDIPKNMGVIARTAGRAREQKDVARDLDYLLRLWHTIDQRAERSKPPALVYQESDPVIRVIRDFFTEEIRRIVVDSEDVHNKVRDFLRAVMPRHVRKVKLYKDADPLFHHFGVEQQIEVMHSRTVQLASGGSIVLEQTEALVAIDVNSGQYKGRGDAEETAFRINMEAAPEIARQIRLRDLGGVLAIDFIDMEDADRRAKVERALWDALKDDKARLRMLKMSPFCIVEMTRQRQRKSLRQSTYVECPCCRGSGHVKSSETLGLQILREIRATLDTSGLDRVEVRVSPELANYLNNEMRGRLGELEARSGKDLLVIADPTMGPGQQEVKLLNADGRELKPSRRS